MARKLKVYITTSGFFELAVAAPTMKAALEIWSAGPDLFHRGYAKPTDDPAIVKATVAKPGIVLRRGVGSSGAFKEHATLPDISLLNNGIKKQPRRKSPPETKSEPETREAGDAAADKKAAKLFEGAQRQREREKARAEAVEKKTREPRDRAIRAADTALEDAQAKHSSRMAVIERRLAELNRSADEENERWKREKQRLEDAVRRVRE